MEVKSADLSLDLQQLSVPVYTDITFSVTYKKQRQLRDEDPIKATSPRSKYSTRSHIIRYSTQFFFIL